MQDNDSIEQYKDYSVVVLAMVNAKRMFSLSRSSRRDFMKMLTRERASLLVMSMETYVDIVEPGGRTPIASTENAFRPTGVSFAAIWLCGIRTVINNDMGRNDVLLIDDKGKAIVVQMT